MPVHFTIDVPLAAGEINEDLLRRQSEWLLDQARVAEKDVSVVLLSDAEMARYNEQYRQRRGPTNVLSFPAAIPPELASAGIPFAELGDILISVETAAREAREKKISLHDRLVGLIIHGFLHLLGLDHERSEEEAWQMWNKEQELFHEMNIARRKNMAQLAVNVDHVATIRQARGGAQPDPVLTAGICELAGAAGIVVHLREDRRHIQERDVRLLRQTITTRLNLEMAISSEIIDIALEVKPDLITLVPEKRQELTTEGGLDILENKTKVQKTIAKMYKAGIPVSLFVDPQLEQIEAAQEVGATYVEIHTGRYCEAHSEQEREREFALIEKSAQRAVEAGLLVNAGHGLDYHNVGRIATLETITEFSIGHAIITRALFVGLDQAVKEMIECLKPHFPGH